MRLLILGSNGNMGRRYASICKQQKIPFIGVDKNDKLPTDYITHAIVATPTDQHIIDIMKLRFRYKNKLKVLCEKPIVKLKDLSELDILKGKHHDYYMVNQYAYYMESIGEIRSDGVTSYNYYNSGKDSIAWDCIQLIYLAKQRIELKNDSPVWKCTINGFHLSRELIDNCYIRMIQDFTSNFAIYRRPWGIETIIQAHKKVLEYESGFNSYPSAVNID